MGWVTALVEQASAWVDWNPGIAPARLVARAQILTLVAGPGAAAKRDRGGWLWLEVALLSLPLLDSALLLNVTCLLWKASPGVGRTHCPPSPTALAWGWSPRNRWSPARTVRKAFSEISAAQGTAGL